MKKILVALSVCSAVVLGAEEVLYRSDFQGKKDLEGWFDMESGYKNGVPQRKPTKPLSHCKLIEANGEVFLKGGQTPRGITHKFSKPLLVNDNLESVTMKVVMRQTPKHGTTLIEIALTSRIQPAADGSAFWRGRDNGIAIRGYSSDVKKANFIYWRKDGSDNKKYRAVRPYNLFPKSVLTEWTACSLTYDHEQKKMTFSCDGMEPLIYHNVDLSGMVLNSLFVNQQNHEYKSIEVTCKRK